MIKLVLRVFLRMSASHYLFPIVIIFIIESAADGFVKKGIDGILDLSHLRLYWLGEQHWLPLALHGVAFAIIVIWVANQRSTISITNMGAFEDCLNDPGVTNYFAIATIRLQEWFEPATQVYFASILAIRRAKQLPHFHQRVMLFFGDNDLKATRSTLFDQHEAECFDRVHTLNDIPLGYLTRPDVLGIIAGLSPVELRSLGWCRFYINRIPALTWLFNLNWIPSRFLLKKPPRQLAFGVVTFDNGLQKVFLFVKRGEGIDVRLLDSKRVPDKHQAYLTLAKRIREQVLPLRHATSFHYFLHEDMPQVLE